MATRKVLVFGGPKLLEPQFTHFDSALTGAPVHGHPGDEALLISPEEAADLKERLYAGLPKDPLSWNAKHVNAYSQFAGTKAILVRDADHYVKMRFASLEEREVDVNQFFGLVEETPDGD